MPFGSTFGGLGNAGLTNTGRAFNDVLTPAAGFAGTSEGSGSSGILGILEFLKKANINVQTGGRSFSIGGGQAAQERKELLAQLMSILQGPRATGTGEQNIVRIGGHPSTPMGTGMAMGAPPTPGTGFTSGFNLDSPGMFRIPR